MAAKLDVGQISDITMRTPGVHPVATTGGGAGGRSAAVETVAVATDSGRCLDGSEIAKRDPPELPAAKIMVSGGRALGGSDKFNEVRGPPYFVFQGPMASIDT